MALQTVSLDDAELRALCGVIPAILGTIERLHVEMAPDAVAALQRASATFHIALLEAEREASEKYNRPRVII